MEDACIFHALRRFADRSFRGDCPGAGQRGVFAKHTHQDMARGLAGARSQYEKEMSATDWMRASEPRAHGWPAPMPAPPAHASIAFKIKVDTDEFLFESDACHHARLLQIVGPVLWGDLGSAEGTSPPGAYLCAMQLCLNQPGSRYSHQYDYLAQPTMIEPLFLEEMARGGLVHRGPMEQVFEHIIPEFRRLVGDTGHLTVCIEITMYTAKGCPGVALLGQGSQHPCVSASSLLIDACRAQVYPVVLPGTRGLQVFGDGAVCEWAAAELALYAPPPHLPATSWPVVRQWNAWRRLVFRSLSFFSDDPYVVCDVSNCALPVLAALAPFILRELQLLLACSPHDKPLDGQPSCDPLVAELEHTIATSTAVLLDGLKKTALQSSIGVMACAVRHLHNAAHEFLVEAGNRRALVRGVDAFLLDCHAAGATHDAHQPVSLTDKLFRAETEGILGPIIQATEALIKHARQSKAALSDPTNPVVVSVAREEPRVAKRKRG